MWSQRNKSQKTTCNMTSSNINKLAYCLGHTCVIKCKEEQGYDKSKI